jgi:hypothetical protein
MTLYQKATDEDGAVLFVAYSAEAEADLRADAKNVFYNDSGHDLLMSAQDAASLKSEWAANDIAAAAIKAAPKPLTVLERLDALEAAAKAAKIM